jgi:hypothetical protein
MVDYYSGFIEVDQLHNTSSQSVIAHCKPHFARHGIPDTLVTDNGPQFSSELFRKFTTSYQFQHYTSSPHYPQSNGRAEKAVQTVKNIIKKASDDKSDHYLALLEYRNMPINDQLGSPTQRLMGRRTKTLVPTTESLLLPKMIKSSLVQKEMKEQKMKQKYYYDQHSHPLQKLNVGDKVSIRKEGRWSPAVVTDVASTPRSYIVTTPEGQRYRRNRRHIIKRSESLTYPDDGYTNEEATPESVNPPDAATVHVPERDGSGTHLAQPRRSSRASKQPDRYNPTWV